MAFYRAQRSAATLRDHNDDVNVVDDDGDGDDDGDINDVVVDDDAGDFNDDFNDDDEVEEAALG